MYPSAPIDRACAWGMNSSFATHFLLLPATFCHDRSEDIYKFKDLRCIPGSTQSYSAWLASLHSMVLGGLPSCSSCWAC